MSAFSKNFSIYSCICPNVFIQFILGCISFRVDRFNKCQVSIFTKIYSKFIRTLIVVTLIFSLYYKSKNLKDDEILNKFSPISILIGITEIILSTISYLLIGFRMDYQMDEGFKLLNKLHELDNNVSMKFNINWNYKKFQRKVQTFTIMFPPVHIIFSALVIRKFTNVIIINMCYIVISIGPGAFSYYYIIIVDIMRLRFRLFQKLSSTGFLKSQYTKQCERIQKTECLIETFKAYCELMEPINRVYGNISVFILLHNFLLLSSIGFFLSIKSIDDDNIAIDLFYVIFFIGPRLWIMLATFVYTHYATYEANKTVEMILRLDNAPTIREVRELIEDFVHWRKQNKLCFTIGITVTDLRLAFTLLGGMANYVLILIQLKSQENNNWKT